MGAIKILKLVVSKPVSLALTIIVPLSIVGWHMVVSARRPVQLATTPVVGNSTPQPDDEKRSNLEAIANEAGSIRKFIGIPVPNNAGTRVLFEQTIEAGVGMFFCRIPGGHRQLLYEQPEKGSHVHDIRFLGWSPDDKYFAYCRRTDKREIVICDGDSGQAVTTIPVSQTIYSGLWLSPQNLVYLDRHQVLREIRQRQGQWSRPNHFKSFKSVPEKDPNDQDNEGEPGQMSLQGLAAAGDAVVWQQGGTIWSCKYDSDAPEKIWESKTNMLLEFCYSSKDQKYLLHCKDQNGEFLASYISGKGQLPARFSELTRISTLPATNVICINGINGFVYLTKADTGRKAFFIKQDNSSEPFIQSWASIKSFSANESQLYVIGARPFTNGLVGIWQYDTISHSFNCVVSNQDSSFKYAKYDTTPPITLTNAMGDKISYTLRPPVDFSPSKKYLVVIGEGWAGYQMAVNDGGAYFASLSREDRSADQYSEDIMAVYKDVAKNPNIDTNNVYLLGISAGASTVSRLLEEKPDLWRGAILFSPMVFPDLSRCRVSRILVDYGTADKNLKILGSLKPLSQFQDAALQAGIRITVATHNDAGHVFKSVNAERERVRELVKFLFED
jgi:predicted esterase